MSEQDTEGRKRLKAKLLHLVQTNPQFRRRIAAILRRKESQKKEATPNQDDSESHSTGDLPMTTLKSDLIRLAHSSKDKEFRFHVARLFVADTPDGGESKDEGGDDEGSEDPGAGEGKTARLQARQEKILKDKAGKAMSFDDLPPAVQAALRKVKDQETLHSDVDRWLGDNNNPHLRSAAVKIAHMPYLSQPGNLSREGIRGKGLTKAVIRSGDGFALYNIDAGRNHSKFYEGYIDESRNGTYSVVFRWGAMTDSGFTGRIDGRKWDEKFSGLTFDQAKRLLDEKKRAKIGGRGYVDTFGPKHLDPVTRKKLKQGEYPIGLAREVGFGWGTQEMAYCVPALRGIATEIAKALDPTDGTDAVVDLRNALKLVSGVPDSSMASKIARFIAQAMTDIARGTEQAIVNKKLFTIKNYIDKQIALCPV